MRSISIACSLLKSTPTWGKGINFSALSFSEPSVPSWRFLVGYARPFSAASVGNEKSEDTIRLSKLLSQHASNYPMSRKQAERLIQQGQVTLAGEVIRTPHLLLNWKELDANSVLIKVQGKGIVLGSAKERKALPKVFAVHKLPGEVVTEKDPQNRPSMMQRLVQGGVGRFKNKQMHLKPIGRLDIPTEGLILLTNDGDYARKMELPESKVQRVYRARVHGRLTAYKLERIRAGLVRFEDIRYGPMKVAVEKPSRQSKSSTNTWLRITSTEGKNRQIRNVFNALGMTVTRLIRVSYGDYSLQTIPPGMAIEVPYKPIETIKARGSLAPKRKKTKDSEPRAGMVKWVRSAQ